jgi:DNA excision repair protein ERCC-5
MGVKDLWQLLSPVGRRLSLESLEGKTLAIDARFSAAFYIGNTSL